MEKQMKLFEEGGLKEEGGMVDEESGNDVPTGSTREEVRDDIPAMLSEGEFVFPADVVRYHGLEKLMELRQEAKMGIKKMEAMGQMGNSDEATLPDDIPFTMDDLIIVAEPMEVKDSKEPKEKAHGGVLHAAEGTYVSPSTGVLGTQQSVYANQPLMGAPTIPVSGQPTNVTQPTTAPVGGYTPLFVGAPTTPTPAPTTPTPTTPFVPTVEDAYTTEKYIDPSTGTTIDINFYQGRPVQAIPAGYIPKSQYDASNMNIKTTGQAGTTGQTGVATTQVTAKDEGIVSQQDLKKVREDAARASSKKRNDFLNKDKFEEADKKLLQKMWTDTRTAQAVSTGVGVIPGGSAVGLFGGAAARREQKKVEDALTKAYKGDSWKKEDWAKGSAIKTGFQQIKDDVAKSFEETFDAEGRKDFYDTYDSKYDVGALGNIAGGGKSYTNENGIYGGNLNVREQQAFDNAVDNGDTNVANHYASIARLRDKQDKFAESGFNETLGMSMGLSKHDMEQAKLYGGSIDTALKQGRAEKTGILKPIVVTNTSKSDSSAVAANASKVSTGAGGSNTNTKGGQSSGSNTASTGRTEAQIQADINAAWKKSGKTWNTELNNLAKERDSARKNEGGRRSGGGGSKSDNGSSGGCCFIMLEARYGDGTMDEVVRRYRDEYMTDRNRRGYYKVAEVLVPLMRKSSVIKWLVTKTFADPLVSYGKYYYGQNKHGVIYSPIKNLWMKLFDIVGGDTEFIRENGETV